MAWTIPQLNYSKALIDPRAITGIGDAFLEGREAYTKNLTEENAAKLWKEYGEIPLSPPAAGGSRGYSDALSPPAAPVEQQGGRVGNAFADAQGGFASTGQAPNSLHFVPPQYRSLIAAAAKKHGIDPVLFAKQTQAESNFNPNAVSPAGAGGISQIMPETAKELGVDPFNVAQALDGQGRYTAQQLKANDGNYGLAFSGYNWGPGSIQKWKDDGADPSKVPAETRNYVQKITGQPIEQWVSNLHQNGSGRAATAGSTAQPATGMPSRAGATIGMPAEASANGLTAPSGMTINGVSLPPRDLLARMLQNKETRPFAAQMIRDAQKGQTTEMPAAVQEFIYAQKNPQYLDFLQKKGAAGRSETQLKDLGPDWGVVDQAGTLLRKIPKDVAGAAAQKAEGKERGEASAALPGARIAVKRTLKEIDEALGHPGRETATGLSGYIDPRNIWPGSDAKNFNVRMAQLKGKSFLEARQMLKGGGQITDFESGKAEAAIARMDAAQSDSEFMVSLKDFRDAVEEGITKLEAQAGGGRSAAPAAPRAPSGGTDNSWQEIDGVKIRRKQ